MGRIETEIARAATGRARQLLIVDGQQPSLDRAAERVRQVAFDSGAGLAAVTCSRTTGFDVFAGTLIASAPASYRPSLSTAARWADATFSGPDETNCAFGESLVMLVTHPGRAPSKTIESWLRMVKYMTAYCELPISTIALVTDRQAFARKAGRAYGDFEMMHASIAAE